jgi:FdhE protein
MNDHPAYLDSHAAKALEEGILTGEMLAFYRALYAYHAEEYSRYRGSPDLPRLGTDELPIASRGMSVLLGEAVSRLLRPGLDPLVEIIRAHHPGLDLSPLRDALAGDASKWMELAGALLGRDVHSLEAFAREHRTGNDEAVFLATNWLKPLFIALADSRDDTTWEDADTERSCPFCGHYPGISLIVGGEEGKRYLSCSLCETRWPFKRIACAVCGTEDADALEYLSMEGVDRYRIDLCHSCRGYIKTVRLDKFVEPEECDPAVENLLTVHLDSAALKKGFRRP